VCVCSCESLLPGWPFVMIDDDDEQNNEDRGAKKKNAEVTLGLLCVHALCARCALGPERVSSSGRVFRLMGPKLSSVFLFLFFF
jgi:hypothetical protein